jgi:predicted SnoaL-like aldol condensation-catalyzing enzyme
MVALKDNLVGAWRLIKYEELPVDGSPTTHPLGERPKGYIIYSADGIMAAFLSSTNEKSKADPIVYAGPYSVDEKQHVVHQQADLTLEPGWAGKTQSRKIRMDGDRLILSTVDPAIVSGRKVNAVITWQRARAMTTTYATDPNKALVVAGITGIFIDRDPAVLDRLFSNDYQQHNPQIANGPAALKALLGRLPADFKYEPGLVLAEGDYVSIHGRYFGWGPKPMVAVDIFRVADGKIAEHWDVMQEEVPAAQSANGNSMLIAPQA